MLDPKTLVADAVRETLVAVAERPELIERREWFAPDEAGEYLRLSEKTLRTCGCGVRGLPTPAWATALSAWATGHRVPSPAPGRPCAGQF